MATVIVIAFVAVWLAVLFVWFRRAAGQSSRNAPAAVATRIGELAPKRQNRADCYGIDGTDLLGRGTLVLTGTEVGFLRWEPAGEWQLPIERITAFDSRMFWPAGEREHAGGTVVGTGERRNALRIFWEGGYGLFWTAERLQWLAALEEATGKERGAAGIQVPLRPGRG